MFLTHTDAVVGDLVFSRSYNSARRSLERSGSFGPAWNHSFEVRIVIRGNPARLLEVRTSDGSPQYYTPPQEGGSRFNSVLPPSAESWILRTPAGYQRVFRAGGDETYDATGRLLAATDRFGVQTTYLRDGQGRLSFVSRLGRGITLEYEGSATRPARLRGPGGVLLATYTYLAGRLDTVQYADESASGYRYTYDPSNLLATVKDLEGKWIEAHAYAGEQVTTTATGGGVDKLTFTYPINKTIVTDALQNVTTYEYTYVRGMRLVTKITGPCSSCGGGGGGDVQEWTYDDVHVKTYKDGEGNLTTYTYDPLTRDLLSETRKPDPSGAQELVTRYTYHPDGRLKTREDPRGGLTTWDYEIVDGEEKETITERVSSTETRSTVIWYNALGKPRLIIDPRQKQTELFYKPDGDLDYVKDPAGKETHFTYDTLGRRTQVIPPPSSGAQEPILEYTVRGQVKSLTDPVHPGRITEFTYDKGGRRLTVRDAHPNRRLTEYVYDLYGRLEKVKQHRDPGEGVLETTYGYDLMSNLRMVRDARGKETWFDYQKNRLWKVRYPLDDGETTSREEVFTYDLAGRLKTRQDRRGVVTTFEYDGLGRLEGKSYSGPIAGSPVTFTYDGAGNLETATQGTTSLAWVHDLAGQVTRAADGLSTLTYDYDPAGNRERLSLVETGFKVRYDYDDPGRLWHIFRDSDTFTFEHDDASRRRTLTLPSGATATSVPDYASRLDTLTIARPGQTLHSFDYDYDEVGNRKRKTVGSVSEDYGYDSVYRLDTVTRAGLAFEDYAYDPVGNRKGTRALPDPSAWAYSNRNELKAAGSAQYSYDRNGNLTGKTDATGTWTYEWDVENRLARVTRNGFEAARFRYDPLGRRIAKIAEGQSTRYSYDGEDIIREIFGHDFREGLRLSLETEQHQYVHGPGVDEPLAVVHGDGQAWYFHADGLGSIVGATDATGAVVQSRSYDAFGNLETGAHDPGYAYTGREWDPETGLYYYRARYYDPKVGRFLGEDPIGFEGGDINLYAYVGNNPVNRVDPMGLQWPGTIPFPIPFPWCPDWPKINVVAPPAPWVIGAGVGLAVLGTGSRNLPTSDLDELYNPEVCGARNEKRCGMVQSKSTSQRTQNQECFKRFDGCMQRCTDDFKNGMTRSKCYELCKIEYELCKEFL
jgi:RHS repeat-associated protein